MEGLIPLLVLLGIILVPVVIGKIRDRYNEWRELVAYAERARELDSQIDVPELREYETRRDRANEELKCVKKQECQVFVFDDPSKIGVKKWVDRDRRVTAQRPRRQRTRRRRNKGR